MKSAPVRLLLLCLTLLATGCSLLPLKLDRLTTAGSNIAYARACAPFGAMSALVYDEAKIDPTKPEGQAALNLRAALRTQLQDDGWTLDPRFPIGERARATGLYYEVWVNATRFEKKVVVVAIRGTESGDDGDTWSNAVWLTRFTSKDNQYSCIVNDDREVNRVFDTYADELAQGKTVVITTGHSLGGGLAQAVRYRHLREVTQCYAFDPSPVTAFHAYNADRRDLYRNLPPVDGFPAQLTLRIYERGEILALLRAPLRWVYPVHHHIRELRFDFANRGNLVSQHSMLHLAQGLAREATQSTEQYGRIPVPWWSRPAR